MLHLLREPHEAEMLTLPSDSLRPLWALNGETKMWSLPSRRAGPSSSVLLSLTRQGDEWAIVDQALAP